MKCLQEESQSQRRLETQQWLDTDVTLYLAYAEPGSVQHVVHVVKLYHCR